jgi:hypothetical protein
MSEPRWVSAIRSFDRVEIIFVECSMCGVEEKIHELHSIDDSKLAVRFPGWWVFGVNGKTKTLCPKCVKSQNKPKRARQ